MRTYQYDQFIAEQIQQGVDLVVNLAAGSMHDLTG